MRYPLWIMLATACAVAGCGPGNGLTMGRVSGVITYKGEPVEFGDILFVPDDSGGTRASPRWAGSARTAGTRCRRRTRATA